MRKVKLKETLLKCDPFASFSSAYLHYHLPSYKIPKATFSYLQVFRSFPRKQLTMLSLSILLTLLPLSLAALNGPCKIDGTPGVCITTANCAAGDGSFRSGFCPNDPDNVKCCIKPECGSGGNCRPSSSCTGTTKTGLCPGPAEFKCCEPKGGPVTPPGGGSTGDRQLSAKGVEFIAGFEGFRANFYIDAAVSVSPYPILVPCYVIDLMKGR